MTATQVLLREEKEDTRKPIGWKPIALDGGYGWVIVLGSFLIHVFADGFVYSFGVIAESLILEFGATNTEVSTILSILTGLMLAVGPLSSAVCNRIGCRITTIIGAIIASIGCAISYRANSMTYLIFSVGIVMGTGFGFMYCPAIVIVTMYFEKYRALATGVTVCGAGVGTFLFSQIIGILIVHFNWRTVFLIYAGLVLLCVPCGALYRPVSFEPIYEGDESKLKEENDGAECEYDEQKGKLLSNYKFNGGSANNGIRSSVSQLLPLSDNSKTESGVLQRFRSLGEHLHIRSGGNGIIVTSPSKNSKSISTGYLNIKDVFYYGSVKALREDTENQQQFRSISSLHSQKDGSLLHKASSHNFSKVTNRTRPDTIANSQVGPKNSAFSTQMPVAMTSDTCIVTQKIEEEPEILEENSNSNGSPKRECSEKNEDKSTASSGNSAIEIWRTIKRLMDLSLLVEPTFLLFSLSNFLTSVGFNAPPMFMPMNAETVLGFSKVDASSTVSAYGLANTFGRITFGLLCDRQLPFSWGKDRARNRFWVYNISLMMCGIASAFVFKLTSFYTFTAYCFFFGFTISSYVCLTSVVLVDLVGVDRLTNAFGLLLFIQGIATFVGPPLAGQLYDLTKRYDWTFVFCGVCLFISGIMLFAIPLIVNRKRYELAETDDETLQLTWLKSTNGNTKLTQVENESNSNVDAKIPLI